MRIVVLGASGMLGHVMFRQLGARAGWRVFGTVRRDAPRDAFSGDAALLGGIDADSHDSLVAMMTAARPDVVVNCIGIVKQAAAARDALKAIPTNALLPHRLARLCELAGARLVHFGTDCVFSGRRGPYREGDPPDPVDLYGRSKLLGEVEARHAVTLRTSIIGRELAGARGLVEWFLSSRGTVKGYRRAVFSGLTTDELARVVADFVIPNPYLHGVYHVSSEPISKHDLLQLLRTAYGHDVQIEPDDEIVLDRSLDSRRFRAATGYPAPAWPEMIARMRECDVRVGGPLADVR